MIRQSQAQRSHAQTIEDATRFDVTVGLCVPLRQDNDGRARFSFAFPTRVEQSRAGGIVYDGRCFDRAGPGESIFGETVIRNLRQGVELRAPSHHALGMLAKNPARIVAVDTVLNELQAPLERADYSIVIALRVRNLAGTHPSS